MFPRHDFTRYEDDDARTGRTAPRYHLACTSSCRREGRHGAMPLVGRWMTDRYPVRFY